MIKKGLKVVVLAGKDKKKEGEVIEIDRQNSRAKVKEINMVKKHIKTTKEKKGGIVSKESFIHISNLKLVENKKMSNLTWFGVGGCSKYYFQPSSEENLISFLFFFA